MKETKTTQTEETKEVSRETEPKKERQDSPTYTLRSFSKLVKKLEKAKMTNDAETAEMKKILKNVTQRWISIGLEI